MRTPHTILVLLLAVPAIALGDDPEPTLAERFMDRKDWKLDQVKGSAVKAPKEYQEYCTAKYVTNRKFNVGKKKRDSLYIGFIGKSSHQCDSPTQVSKTFRLDRSMRLRFFVSNYHVWGGRAQLGLRVLDGAKRPWYTRRIEAGSNDMKISVMRELLFLVKAPVEIRLVLDTTCRAITRISDVSATAFVPRPLDEKTRAEIDRLVGELGDRDFKKREAATQGLRTLLGKKRPGGPGPMFVRFEAYEALKKMAEKAGTLEAKARIRDLLTEIAAPVVDLRQVAEAGEKKE